MYLIKQLCHCWLHISTLFHHAGKLYMKRLHSIYNTLVIKNILEKAFYFLLLHMFTQYLLLLLLQAVLYYFKSSGNYVCCLYSHLHQALVIETCSISQTKWHRTVSTYIQTIISEKRTGQPLLLVPIFPDHFDLENKFSPCCKGF